VITLRFVMGYGPSSWAIALFSAGHFSHVDAVVPKGGLPNIEWLGGSLVGSRSDRIGGKPPGLQCRPYGYERVKRVVLFHLPATREQVTAFWAFLYSQETHKYDKAGILAFAFNSNLHSPGQFFCSAAMLDALQSADRIRPLYRPYSKTTPVGLADLLAQGGASWEPASTAAAKPA
jgi:hypothetical protein